MKCQKCEHTATVHITDMIEGEPKEVHLCEACAHEFLSPENDLSEEIMPAMAGLLAQHLAVGETAKDLAELDQKICPVCGITFLEFRQKGRLGCPHDYQFFAEELEPLLMNIHGETSHIGKVPLSGAANAEQQTQLIRYRREMKEAVTHENYELAASLRDKIHLIENLKKQ